MKRFITILAALLAFGLAASAQLNVTGSVAKTEKIATARMGALSLWTSGNGVYMSLPSNNQFEESELFWLGTTVEEATKTMEDLVGLFDTLEDSVSVKDALGTSVMLTRKGPALYFSYSSQAGLRWLAKSEAKKFLKALQAMQ